MIEITPGARKGKGEGKSKSGARDAMRGGGGGEGGYPPRKHVPLALPGERPVMVAHCLYYPSFHSDPLPFSFWNQRSFRFPRRK